MKEQQGSASAAVFPAPHPEFRRQEYWKAAQPLLTWLTGRAVRGEQALCWTPGTTLVYVVLLLLGGGVLGCTLAWAGSPFFLIPALVTLHAARVGQLLICHLAAHVRFMNDSRIDPFLGRVLSILLLIESYDRYRHGHISHHSAALSTDDDPTVKFLRRAGFYPGMTVRAAWLNLACQIVNPWFHLREVIGRISSHANSGPLWCRGVMGAYLLLIAIGSATPISHGILWGWLLPVTLMTNVSMLLRLQVEHIYWPQPRQRELQTPYVERTVDILLFEPLPAPAAIEGRQVNRWPGFILRTFGHVLARLFVLVADTPVHASHHLLGGRRTYDGVDYVNSRARHLEAGEPFLEIRGLFRTIGVAFEALSRRSCGR